VRQLFPSPADPSDTPSDDAQVDPLEVYDEVREAPEGRPWVIVDMVSSVDGATAVAGRSGGLGGPGDKAVFRALRAVPDVILVGAATARVERYGPVRLDDEVRARRVARGQSSLPRLALVSGRLDLDPDAVMFTEAAETPLVFTTERAAEQGGRFEGRAELVALGPTSVDLTKAVAELDRRGAQVVLAEGGPHLNGQLVAAGLVDEWCQSVAPMLVAGDSARVAHGTDPAAPVRLVLHRLLEQDGYLFLTYRRAE
jgi:riboflavin biosynthesis pyrimidine reductase